MIGEIGGHAEEDAAEWLTEHNKENKPIVTFIAGKSAPPGKRMGHAGAIISGGKGTADQKIETLRNHGVTVTTNPAKMGETIFNVMKERGLL